MATKASEQPLDLAVPLYLDEPAMLDLLASIDNGFSTVERIRTRSADTGEREGALSADAGSTGILSGIFKIGFSTSARASHAHNNDSEREGDRYHTPGSLLHRLRSLLSSHGLLARLDSDPDSWASIRPSQFVEFRGSIAPNPFGHAIRTLGKSLELIQNLSDLPSGGSNGPERSRKPQPKRDTAKQSSTFERTLNLITSDLEQSDVQLLLVKPSTDSLPLDYSVVATIANGHLRVPTLNELSDGEYRVLGHVTRHLPVGTEGSINILRGSVLGALAENEVDKIVQSINEPLEEQEWRLQGALTSVKPPAVQLFPIAIYT